MRYNAVPHIAPEISEEEIGCRRSGDWQTRTSYDLSGSAIGLGYAFTIRDSLDNDSFDDAIKLLER